MFLAVVLCGVLVFISDIMCSCRKMGLTGVLKAKSRPQEINQSERKCRERRDESMTVAINITLKCIKSIVLLSTPDSVLAEAMALFRGRP